MTTETAIQDGDLFNETLIQSYVSRDKNPRFLARPWLAEQVEAALRLDDCRFVLLTAEPGAGKTAFMAWLGSEHPDWPRYFIRRDQRTQLQDADDHSFLLRIGYQLAAIRPELFSREQVRLVVEQRLGSVGESGEAVGVEVGRLLASPFHQKVIRIRQYVERTAGAVTGLKIDELVVESRLLSPEDLQNMALFDPALALQAADPEARIVILVDALDEIRYHGVEGSLLEWLTYCPELPDNVRFVLTSRPPDGPTKLFCEKQAPFLQRLTIQAEDEPVQRELEDYARSLAEEPDVASILKDTKGGAAWFVEEAVAKADGNIGYLDALARGVDQARTSKDQKGLRKLLTLGELPKHIEGLYAFFIRQIKESVGERGVRVRDPRTGESYILSIWDEVYWPILGVLCVVGEPLLPDAIRRLGAIEVEERYVIRALDGLGQFLDLPDGRCRLYHATLPEFLTAETTQQNPETQDLAIQPKTWHWRIADYYWEKDHPNWQKLEDDLDGAYGLNHLAPHLFASQDDRLGALIDQAWMAARFEGSGYTYDGFIDDLMLAWQAAHEEALAQIEAGQSPVALADCVRCALIRSSINSLAGNYLAELVTRAVETGLWPVERALSVANRVPAPGERADMFAALLATGHLNDEQGTQARKAGLESALAIESKWARGQALARLSPYLTGDARAHALAQALEAALAHPWNPFRVRALAALAPQLTGEARTQALARALEAALPIRESSMEERMALEALAPQLTDEALEAHRPQSPHETLTELSRLASRPGPPQLPGLPDLEPPTGHWVAQTLNAMIEKDRALAHGLESALALKSEEERARALASLAPQLTDEALARAVKAVMAFGDWWNRKKALEALAPCLTGEALMWTLEAALDIDYPPHRAQALTALAPQLIGEALVRGLDAALAFTDQYWRAGALAALASQLMGEARRRALMWAVEAALSTRKDLRSQALARLARQSSSKVLAQGLEAVLAIGDERDRAQALVALMRQLDDKALARVLKEFLGENGDRALEAILGDERVWPQLTREQQEDILDIVLDKGMFRDDGMDRGSQLAELAPQLTGETLARAMEAALTLEDEGERARALAGLGPQATGEALARGLEAALAIGDEGARAMALMAFLPMVPDRAAVLRNVRQAIAEHLLKNLSADRREEVLKFCAEEKLFASPILDQVTLAAIAGHIVKVCQDWRWM